MRTVGLLGGMTWHSTATYYTRINEGVARRLGPYRSASLVMHSIDYGTLRDARLNGQWRRFTRQLVSAARGLHKAGADGLFLCSNTIHALAPDIAAQVPIPVVHIADALAARVKADGHQRVALFGTGFTMRQPFYRERLAAHGLDVVVPDEATIDVLDRIILDELAAGVVRDESRQRFLDAMQLPADVVVLGCTEIGMLVQPDMLDVPVLDTTLVHADHAVDWLLEG